MNFSAQFSTIDQVLSQTRQYWQILPFQHLSLPWPENTRLVEFLNSLSLSDIEQLDGDDELLRSTFADYLEPALDCIKPLSMSGAVAEPGACPDRFKAGIKGRKWSQIERLAALVSPSNHQVLEWCAGKGHLGRLISYQQQRAVVSVEWQDHLCQQGQLLSDKFLVNQTFVQADVLQPSTDLVTQPKQQVVALHACGQLHLELLKQAQQTKTQDILLAPCCYHIISTTVYQPLSAVVQASDLALARRDLNLSVQQTVVATEREKKHRAIEVAWRLGFDLLQRSLRDSDQYIPLPSIKQSMLTATFEQFCHWACAKKNIELPADTNFDSFEQAGWQRRLTNGRIEIVTHAFRQLLERWLLLDRVLYLEQHGYQVSLVNFCEREITPRNAVIIASYQAG